MWQVFVKIGLAVAITGDLAALASVLIWYFFCGFDEVPLSRKYSDVNILVPFVNESEVVEFLRRNESLISQLASSEQVILSKSSEMIPGENPKVTALKRGLSQVKCRYLLMMDSNSCAGAFFLESLFEAASRGNVGLVFSPVSSLLPVSAPEHIDAAIINTTVVKSMLAAQFLGLKIAMGKAMLLDTSRINAKEAFEHAGKFLAEDARLAQFVASKGCKIKVSGRPVYQGYDLENEIQPFSRFLRWMRLQLFNAPLIYLLVPLENPIIQAALLAAYLRTSGLPGAEIELLLLLFVGVLFLVENEIYRRIQPRGFLAFSVWISKSVYTLLAWGLAPFSRHVKWRGRPIKLTLRGKIASS